VLHSFSLHGFWLMCVEVFKQNVQKSQNHPQALPLNHFSPPPFSPNRSLPFRPTFTSTSLLFSFSLLFNSRGPTNLVAQLFPQPVSTHWPSSHPLSEPLTAGACSLGPSPTSVGLLHHSRAQHTASPQCPPLLPFPHRARHQCVVVHSHSCAPSPPGAVAPQAPRALIVGRPTTKLHRPRCRLSSTPQPYKRRARAPSLPAPPPALSSHAAQQQQQPELSAAARRISAGVDLLPRRLSVDDNYIWSFASR
jgi:hypothetical protein